MKLARALGLVGWTLEVPGVKAEAYRDTRGPGLTGVRSLVDALDARQDSKRARDRAASGAPAVRSRPTARRGGQSGRDGRGLGGWHRSGARQGPHRAGGAHATHPTREALAAWLAVRGAEPGPLFVNYDRAGKGRRLTGTSLYRLVRRLGAGVGLTVRPHGLRHAAITEALELTAGDLRRVQRFSRHRDVRTIGRYDDNRQDLGGEVARQVASTV